MSLCPFFAVTNDTVLRIIYNGEIIDASRLRIGYNGAGRGNEVRPHCPASTHFYRPHSYDLCVSLVREYKIDINTQLLLTLLVIMHNQKYVHTISIDVHK